MNGRHSKLLPKNLQQMYQDAINDPELLHLKSESAILDARLCELLQQVYTGENGGLWLELRETYQFLETARTKGDKKAMAQALSKLGQIIHEGASQSATWHDQSGHSGQAAHRGNR